MLNDVSQIRSTIRARRNAVARRSRIQWSEAACERVFQLEGYKNSKRIGAFLAFDGEADPASLMARAFEDGKQVHVPIIVGKGKPLKFAPWRPGVEMKPNRFGIDEPVCDPADWLDASELDFVVTPLVAFDESCNRIGVGGGFYDRTFSFLHELGKGKPVMLVGFAFELQKLDLIEPQSWDVRLDAVVTQSRVYQ